MADRCRRVDKWTSLRSGGSMQGCIVRNEGLIRANTVLFFQAGESTQTPSGRVNCSGGFM